MPCKRCKNPAYPDDFVETKASPREDRTVRCCKQCGYPLMSDAARNRIAGKLRQVKHVVVAPRATAHGKDQLKKIDPKYLGETLDPQRRPLEDLHELQKEWERVWDKNYLEAPNFYDWVGTQKGGARVLQLNAEERVPYEVKIREGCLVGGFVENKYSDYAFVLDGFGKFYAAPKSTSGEMRIHHSTFLSGAPVQCAGVFFCTGAANDHSKKIVYVKDYSGHYQPGLAELRRLKKRLVDIGEGDLQLWYYGAPPSPVPKFKGAIKTFTGAGQFFTDLPLKEVIAQRIQAKKAH